MNPSLVKIVLFLSVSYQFSCKSIRYDEPPETLGNAQTETPTGESVALAEKNSQVVSGIINGPIMAAAPFLDAFEGLSYLQIGDRYWVLQGPDWQATAPTEFLLIDPKTQTVELRLPSIPSPASEITIRPNFDPTVASHWSALEVWNSDEFVYSVWAFRNLESSLSQVGLTHHSEADPQTGETYADVTQTGNESTPMSEVLWSHMRKNCVQQLDWRACVEKNTQAAIVRVRLETAQAKQTLGEIIVQSKSGTHRFSTNSSEADLIIPADTPVQLSLTGSQSTLDDQVFELGAGNVSIVDAKIKEGDSQ